MTALRAAPLLPATGKRLDRRLATLARQTLRAACALALASVVPAVATAQEGPQMNLQRVELTAGMHRIDAQLAQAPQERQTGLMFRKEMPQHEGMLFVFEQPTQQCFWMKNTLLPLTAAFVADDGTIVNLADMKPQTLDSHCSAKPVRYVLEMNQGWFAKKGIKAGTKLVGAPFSRK
ncbi:DUF192 domain-containing protein [Acidovorax sp.]|uniref:DUF192 domain-containing protein n=1 Tax=Acidovorax sp. TaxID=1872122 RepID=UPI002606ED67|nr:DUF192 domain-containing protein [Acidovorax sp.]